MVVQDLGNTSSTSLFVVLYTYLQNKRLKKGDRLLIIPVASGLNFGVLSLTLGDLEVTWGVVIKATGISTDVSLHDSVEHAVRAGSACIDAAGIDRNDISLVLNVGIYRNNNIVEPANASLIQNSLDINPMYIKGRTTFSFDILNGACGFLNAAQVAGAVLRTTDVKYVLIVSSDVHPSKEKVVNFPYRNIGAAALLEWSDDPQRGFQEIIFRTSRNGLEELESIVDLSVPGARRACAGQTLRKISRASDRFYRQDADRCLRGAQGKTQPPIGRYHLRDLAARQGFWFPGYRDGGHAWKIGGMSVRKVRRPHSSALTIAYHEARASGDIEPGDQVVFVGASAGLTVSVGLYLEQRRARP